MEKHYEKIDEDLKRKIINEELLKLFVIDDRIGFVVQCSVYAMCIGLGRQVIQGMISDTGVNTHMSKEDLKRQFAKLYDSQNQKNKS